MELQQSCYWFLVVVRLFPSYLIVCSHLTGKAILTTIQENKDLLQELFSATPTVSESVS